ncbi:MAG: acyl carrier protein [Deltaproteobacteria bacterium]|nr:acyl carrier protein [Deltaproteobacteria bacterium]
MKTQEAIFGCIQRLLVEVFEIQPERVVREADIYKDLDFDSLDAVELAVRLGAETGISLQEDDLRAIRTIGDTVDILYQRGNA